MAEEAFDIPANMEKIEPRDFSWRRNSTGNINTKICSTEANNVVLPRYLSAPFASCHDSCKYGSNRSNNDEAARTHLKRFASKLQKKPASEEENVDMQREKKFAATLRLPSYPKKQTTSQEHDIKRVVHVSAKQHQISSSKTKGISRSSQKDSTVQSSESRATRTKHRNSSIPRKASQLNKRQPKKQDSADEKTLLVIKEHKQDSADEEHVPEKTLFVIKEHKEDSTNHNSSCCLEETELNSEQENVSSLPRKLVFTRGKIVEGKLYKDGAISPRKVVVQYIFLEGNKDSAELFDSTIMEETANKPAAENVFGNVKTLIGVFESVISFQDGSSSPAAAENRFSNVKALISVFESVISHKLLAPSVTGDTSLIDSTN